MMGAAGNARTICSNCWQKQARVAESVISSSPSSIKSAFPSLSRNRKSSSRSVASASLNSALRSMCLRMSSSEPLRQVRSRSRQRTMIGSQSTSGSVATSGSSLKSVSFFKRSRKAVAIQRVRVVFPDPGSPRITSRRAFSRRSPTG
jgi:hypothetical protein